MTVEYISKDFIRPDLLFSYWIYFWFLLFYFGQDLSSKDLSSKDLSHIIKKYANPSLIFWIALLENIGTLLVLFVKIPQVQLSVLVKYIIMILVVKGIPLYLLWPYNIHFYRDILIILTVFIVYLGYLWLNGTNVFEIYHKTFDYVAKGDNRTPMFAVFDWIKGTYGHFIVLRSLPNQET